MAHIVKCTSDNVKPTERFPLWGRDFITDLPDGSFEAWDETQAGSLGVFPTYAQAAGAVMAYAKTLD